MAKAILKKNKIGGLKLPDFKTYYQPVITRQCNTDIASTDRYWKRAPRSRPTFMVFLQRHQSNTIGRAVFSTDSAKVSEYPHGKMDILPLPHIKHKNQFEVEHRPKHKI